MTLKDFLGDVKTNILPTDFVLWLIEMFCIQYYPTKLYDYNLGRDVAPNAGLERFTIQTRKSKKRKADNSIATWSDFHQVFYREEKDTGLNSAWTNIKR